MATLSSTLILNDKFSKVIDRAMGKTTKMEKVIMQASGSADKLDASIGNIGKNTSGMDSVIGKLGKITALGLALKKTLDGMFSGVGLNAQQTSQLNALQANYGDAGGKAVYDWVSRYAAGSVLGREDLMQSVSMSAPFIRNASQLEQYLKFMDRPYAKDLTQGAQGAAFAMKELISGDVMSIRLRYGITGFSGDKLRKLSQAGDYDGLFNYMNEVFNQYGATEKLVEKNLNNIMSQWNIFTSNFKTKFGEAMETVVGKLSPVVDKLNQALDTGALDIFINAFVGASQIIATIIGGIVDGVMWIGQAVQDNWNIVQPILISLGLTLFVLFNMMLVNFGRIAIGWMVAFWPVALVIGLVSLLIYWILEMGDSFIKTCEIIGGSVNVMYVLFNNLVTLVANSIYVTFNAVDNFITGCVNVAISGINLLIEQLNRLPGVAIPALNKFEGLIKDGLEVEYMSIGDAWNQGKSFGNDFGTSTKSGVDKLAGMTEKVLNGFGSIGGLDAPIGNMDELMVNGALPIDNCGG